MTFQLSPITLDQRIQQLAGQCKAQRCYDSQSRQLKNEGEKFFSALRADGTPLRPSTHCLRQCPYHSKNASYGPVMTVEIEIMSAEKLQVLLWQLIAITEVMTG